MKRNILLILLITLVSIFNSCEKEIEFKGKITEPLLVLNGYLNTDSLVKIHVSKSRFLLGEVTRESLSLNNAEVKLYVNGELKETLKNIKDGFYIGKHYLPKEADIVKIEASAAGFKSVEAVVTIPPKPRIRIESMKEEIYKRDDIVIISGDKTIDLFIKKVTVTVLLDEPKAQNYYAARLYYKMKKDDDSLYSEESISISDVLSEYIRINDSKTDGLIDFFDIEANPVAVNKNYFNDFLFNGKQVRLKYTLNKPYYNTSYDEKKQEIITEKNENEYYYRISLAEVTDELFKFFISSEKAYKASEKFFAEPVQIVSNVSSGAGIIGVSNSAYIDVTIK